MATTIEQSVYRLVVDEEFRSLMMAELDLFGLGGLVFPEAVEWDVQQDLAGTAMAGVDVRVVSNTCSWGVTVRCDKLSN